MKYTLRSIAYMLRNLFFMFPVVALPALFLSVSTDQAALRYVLDAFLGKRLHTWDFYRLFCSASIINFATWKAVAFGAVGIIAIIFSISMLMAFLEKHMRFGKRTFNGMFSKINDNIAPTFSYTMLVVVIYELWALLIATFLYLASRITTVWLAYTAVSVIMVAFHVILLYAINIIYLWLPCMQITGFRGAEALPYANHLATAPIKWRLIFGQMLTLFCVEGVIFLCAALVLDFWTFTIVSTLLYAVLIMVYCARMEIVYFDLDNIERRDLKKYYQK